MSVAAFITAQRAQHRVPTATACRALGVSPAWYYKWRDGDPSPRRARRAALAAQVARLFAAHHGRYGSPRITAELRAAGWRVSENTVAAADARAGSAGPAAAAAPAHHPPRRGPVAGTGPGRAPVRRRRAQPPLVRRRHRDRHRRGQAAPGQRVGHGLAADRRVRPVRAPRRRAGLRGAGDGGRGPRRPGGDRRGGAAHRPGQRVHRAVVPRRLRPLRHHASRWAGPARRWTTRSSSPGTPRWSSSCAGSSSSPPRPRPGPGSRPGSRSTTATGGTPHWACAARWTTNAPCASSPPEAA